MPDALGDLDAVAALHLGAVEREVSRLEERIQCGAGVGLGDAGADGGPDCAAADLAARLGEGDADALGSDVGRADAGTRQQGAELLAAEAADEIGAAQRLQRRVAERVQHFVARAMTEGVVDRLEGVEVEQNDRQRRVLLDGWSARMLSP